MNTFPANLLRILNQRIVLRSLHCSFVVIFGCMFFGMSASTIQAAGCHSSTADSPGVDPFGNPLPPHIVKTYNGGDFQYYEIAEGKPCDGPNCRGVPPIQISSQPAVIASDRVDLSFLSVREAIVEPFYAGSLCCNTASQHAAPFIGGLLRPPSL